MSITHEQNEYGRHKYGCSVCAGLGIDYDLDACLEYNPQDFQLEDITEVFAIVEGEADEFDWHWLLGLDNGTFAYLTGGCDYTGWD
jgi:hypothetical protein